jgi:hypothetical protein
MLLPKQWVFVKRSPNCLNLRALLRRLCDYPELRVVAEWFNRKEGLALDVELAEIVRCRQRKAPLLSYKFRAWNFRDDTWNVMPAQQKITHAEAGELSLIITKVASLHDGNDRGERPPPTGTA